MIIALIDNVESDSNVCFIKINDFSMISIVAIGARVSTSTWWALGTSGGCSGRARCQQRQADEVKDSGMSGSLQRQLVGYEYLISSGFQALSLGVQR